MYGSDVLIGYHISGEYIVETPQIPLSLPEECCFLLQEEDCNEFDFCFNVRVLKEALVFPKPNLAGFNFQILPLASHVGLGFGIIRMGEVPEVHTTFLCAPGGFQEYPVGVLGRPSLGRCLGLALPLESMDYILGSCLTSLRWPPSPYE